MPSSGGPPATSATSAVGGRSSAPWRCPPVPSRASRATSISSSPSRATTTPKAWVGTSRGGATGSRGGRGAGGRGGGGVVGRGVFPRAPAGGDADAEGVVRDLQGRGYRLEAIVEQEATR